MKYSKANAETKNVDFPQSLQTFLSLKVKENFNYKNQSAMELNRSRFEITSNENYCSEVGKLKVVSPNGTLRTQG